jgi:hypothetical protein
VLHLADHVSLLRGDLTTLLRNHNLSTAKGGLEASSTDGTLEGLAFFPLLLCSDVSKIELSVMPKQSALSLGKCVNMKPTTLPVLVFSVGGMIGNFVNDYSDVVSF